MPDLSNFAQLTVSGIALGCLYALVALGFVIVLKSSSVLNMVQGSFVLLGAYLTYQVHVTWGAPFAVAVGAAVVGVALLGVVTEVTIVRRIPHRAEFSTVMVTLGLLVVVQTLVAAVWGYDPLNMGDPWGLSTVDLGGTTLSTLHLTVIGASVIVLLLFAALFRWTRVGLAMRAASADREAAIAQGISPGLVLGISWLLAGSVGALAGVALGSAAQGGLRITIDLVALAALPAVIFGGLDSLAGAVIGSLVIGLAQLYAAGYAPDWAGAGFPSVMPYVVMIVVLLVRPRGLFGSQEVRRA